MEYYSNVLLSSSACWLAPCASISPSCDSFTGIVSILSSATSNSFVNCSSSLALNAFDTTVVATTALVNETSSAAAAALEVTATASTSLAAPTPLPKPALVTTPATAVPTPLNSCRRLTLQLSCNTISFLISLQPWHPTNINLNEVFDIGSLGNHFLHLALNR